MYKRQSLYRPELWYTEMEEDKYEFPETVHIPVGSCVEQLNIDFNLQGIDMLVKWLLPLSLVDDASSNYQSHPRKNYAKALLRVLPFNDYSGSYTASSMKVYTYITVSYTHLVIREILKFGKLQKNKRLTI